MSSIYSDNFPVSISNRIDSYKHSFFPSGWIKIILELNIKLRKINPNYIISQIKQKNGELRFYSHNIEDKDYYLIHDSVKKSKETCEVCGSGGIKRVVNHYQIVLCDIHHKQLNSNKHPF